MTSPDNMAVPFCIFINSYYKIFHFKESSDAEGPVVEKILSSRIIKKQVMFIILIFIFRIVCFTVNSFTTVNQKLIIIGVYVFWKKINRFLNFSFTKSERLI